MEASVDGRMSQSRGSPASPLDRPAPPACSCRKAVCAHTHSHGDPLERLHQRAEAHTAISGMRALGRRVLSSQQEPSARLGVLFCRSARAPRSVPPEPGVDDLRPLPHRPRGELNIRLRRAKGRAPSAAGRTGRARAVSDDARRDGGPAAPDAGFLPWPPGGCRGTRQSAHLRTGANRSASSTDAVRLAIKQRSRRCFDQRPRSW